MKELFFIFIMLLCQPYAANADDERWATVSKKNPAITAEIDPDKHIFGLNYGTTEEEFIHTFGSPDGYIRLNKYVTVLIYGKSTAFLFREGQLDGVRIVPYGIMDWRLGKEMYSSSMFDSVGWYLSNGVQKNDPRDKLDTIMNHTIDKGAYEWTYETEAASVVLGFSHHTQEGNAESAYRVSHLEVRKKGGDSTTSIISLE